jgi:hypothetical protein
MANKLTKSGNEYGKQLAKSTESSAAEVTSHIGKEDNLASLISKRKEQQPLSNISPEDKKMLVEKFYSKNPYRKPTNPLSDPASFEAEYENIKSLIQR